MSFVALVSGRYASPSSSSELTSDQRFAWPEYDHESFSQVSLPTSPGLGITRNAQRGLPVRTSNACTFPGGCSFVCGASLIWAPTITTSRQTCGPLLDE